MKCHTDEDDEYKDVDDDCFVQVIVCRTELRIR